MKTNSLRRDIVNRPVATRQLVDEAHASFVAYAHAIGDASSIHRADFTKIVTLKVLGEIRHRLGPLGQTSKLYQDDDDYRAEERKPPTKIVGDNHEAYQIARTVHERVVAAVAAVYRPDSLQVIVSGISRVEEPGEEPFTAVLVKASSLISNPVVLAIYAERV